MPEAKRPPNFTRESYAQSLDTADPLAGFRDRFYIPPGTIYLDGILLILRGLWANTKSV